MGRLWMGEVIKSGVAATFPLRGDVHSGRRRWRGARRVTFPYTPPPPPTPATFQSIPPPNTPPPPVCQGSLGLGGGQGSRRQPSGLSAQGEVTRLAYTMALSQFQPRLLQRRALPVPPRALPVLGFRQHKLSPPSPASSEVLSEKLRPGALAFARLLPPPPRRASVGGILGNCTMLVCRRSELRSWKGRKVYMCSHCALTPPPHTHRPPG